MNRRMERGPLVPNAWCTKVCVVLLSLLLPGFHLSAYAMEIALEEGFQNPPNSARPRVWWHWMNGNISQEGIRKDIEWMSRVGIGGLQNFDAALSTPLLVEKRLVYMTPEWKEAFRYAAQQADEHDLELAIAGSPGWSETGGPWVQPEDAMKKLVWSETVLEGGRHFAGELPALPATTGLFQDLPTASTDMSMSGEKVEVPSYTRDIAVLAFPLEPMVSTELPRMTVAGADLDTAALTNGKYNDSVDVPKGTAEKPATIEMTYAQPRAVRALTFYLPGQGGIAQNAGIKPQLEVSTDGETWRSVVEVPLSEVPTTVSFAPVTAQYFRLVLHILPSQNILQLMGNPTPGVDMLNMMRAFGEDTLTNLAAIQSQGYQLAELSLQAQPRVNAFEFKAGFALADDYYALDDAGDPDTVGVLPGEIVNLTDRLAADGRFEWTPPPGRWKVLRLGYSLTGKTNHPAPVEATGLEVDKYDGEAVRRYLQTYLGMYREAAGESLVGARGVRALLIDSIEVGPSNWTPNLIGRFEQLRGYDPTPWLPVLTGVVVGSRAQSDAFLYDFRRTLADLIASEHYGEIARFAGEQGLVNYSEALESQRVALGDDMAMRAHADIPMAAIWHNGGQDIRPVHEIDILGAASVAHIHGQNLVAAESLTSILQPWSNTPAELRPTIDLAFARGLNRPVIHTSVHQPVDDKQPGLALMIFGQYFNRHETWSGMAAPWVTYLARTSFLLQQGRHGADVAYFYGEEAPLVELYKDGLPADAPRRHAFDFINAGALLGAISVEGADLVATGGARYRLLYLGGTSERMTLPLLRQLQALAEAGATIVGRPPVGSPALADDPSEYAALVQRLWGAGEGATVGRGRVINSADVEAVLASMGVAPDFRFAANKPDGEILFQHRRLQDGDIYFLSNRARNAQAGDAHFRVTGKAPEVWRADTGERTPVSYRIEDGETVIPLSMESQDSFFIVFRKPAEQASATVGGPNWIPVANIGAGSWKVNFQSARGAPANVQLPSLTPLNEHTDAGVRYFSGVASYKKSFELPQDVRPGEPLKLDLGALGDVAEVFVNGVMAGTVWREPHQIGIGELIRPGSNDLEIRVANLWVNRLIGDAQPGAQKVTWTSTPIFLPDAPLRVSGLVGPVQLLAQPDRLE